MTQFLRNSGTPGDPEPPTSYGELLGVLRAEVAEAPNRHGRDPDPELVRHYWRIGRAISRWYRDEGDVPRIYARLSADLRAHAPKRTGLVDTNLVFMRKLAEAWPDGIEDHPVSRIPWRHITLLLNAVDTRDERDFYAARILEYRWSRSVLTHMVDLDLYAITRPDRRAAADEGDQR